MSNDIELQGEELQTFLELSITVNKVEEDGSFAERDLIYLIRETYPKTHNDISAFISYLHVTKYTKALTTDAIKTFLEKYKNACLILRTGGIGSAGEDIFEYVSDNLKASGFVDVTKAIGGYEFSYVYMYKNKITEPILETIYNEEMITRK